jgi:glycosyltransferase involved in cell wall biosynthesis
LLGLFGYAYEGVARELVLDTLAQLRAAGADARLLLLGAPGPGSAHGLAWRAAAERRGLSRALAFSDVLPAQELADAIAGCAVLLCAAAQGPTPTRGTLAASLASGRPVVAIDGPRTWSELIQSEAALLVAPTAAALAGALARVLADEPGREALGARGRAFYEQRMALELSAELISALLREGA